MSHLACSLLALQIRHPWFVVNSSEILDVPTRLNAVFVFRYVAIILSKVMEISGEGQTLAAIH